MNLFMKPKQTHRLRKQTHNYQRGKEGGSESENESHSAGSNSLRPHELYSPWNSPGQNTGKGWEERH